MVESKPINETLPAGVRRQMLREAIHHQEAFTRSTWSQPPMEPGDNAPSYAEMMLDPTVAYSVRLLQEAVLAEQWHVEPAQEAVPRAAALAEDIRMQLDDIGIEHALQDGLDALWRGFWAHEITWGYAGRRHHLESLAAIDPDQIALELDTRMRITAVLSKPTGADPTRHPVEKLWLHVHRPSRTRPAGESVLEPAYRAWSSKNRLLQFWGLSIQRFGMTALKAIMPNNTPPARQSTILSTLHAGRLDGVYLVPDDCVIEEMNPTQWANLTFEKAVDYQDHEIAKAILLERSPGSVATGQTYVTGAGLQEQARATAFRMKRISRALADSFNRQVIQPLCRSNYGLPPSACPRLVLPTPDANRLVGLAPALAQLRTAGMLDPDAGAELLGLPAPKMDAPAPAADEKSRQDARRE